MSIRILFIDACERDALDAAAALRDHGVELEPAFAPNIEAAAAVLRSESWDAVVARDDGNSALGTLSVVREVAGDLPFILLSDSMDEERAADAIRSGVNDYVMRDRLGRLPAALRREITAAEGRHDLEHSLRRAEERYRQTFQRAPVGIANADREGRFVDVNACFAEMLGYAREELIGIRFADISHPDDTEFSLDVFADLLSGKRSTAQYDRRYLTRDGGMVWANVNLSTIRDESGEVAYVIGLIEDNTVRRQIEEELRRRTIQQSALANLGQIVISGSSVEFILEQAVSALGTIFGASITEILQHSGGDMSVVASFGGDEGSSDVRGETHSQATLTISTGHPVIANDLGSETRFTPSERLLNAGVVGSVTIPIPSDDGTAWGVLALHTSSLRPFLSYEIEFLRSAAALLGQAIDRAASDAELRTRARRQSAIAAVGRLALTAADEHVFDQACELLSHALDADFAFLSELTAAKTLRVRAGNAWSDEMPPEVEVREDDHLGATVITRQPVVVPDYASDVRADASKYAVPLGIRSGVTVPLAAGSRILGVLCASSRNPGHFGSEEVDFLQTGANILADAIERDRVRVAIRESEQRYRRIFDGSTEIIFSCDQEGRFTTLNPAFETITGWPRHEWAGRTFAKLIAPDDRERASEVLIRIMTTKAAVETRIKAVGKDRIVDLEVTAFPHFENGVITEVYGFARDVTDALHAAEEQKKLEGRLEQADRLASLGRLAATVAHEFNNVLMGIAPFVEVIRRSPSPEKVSTALEHIMTSVKRGRRVTQDILRFTQPAEPARTSVDVLPWLRTMAAEARSLLPPQIAIYTEAEPLHIDVDPNQLHQIVTNLVLNARDALGGSGTVSLTVRREPEGAVLPFGTLDDPSRYAHLMFRDTGSGMDEETLRHAFEPLFTTKRSGTGLGLAVAHQVVQRHGGEIFAQSSVGAGTTFHIFLPLAAEDSRTPVPETGSSAGVPAKVGQRLILLVEDDINVAAGLRILLEMEGFIVSGAVTGAEAIQSVRQQVPDAVVLDVGLPDMDGLRVYAALREIHPDLPVVFSTGHADRSRMEDFLERPHVSYLLKPYERSALLDELARVLRSGGA